MPFQESAEHSSGRVFLGSVSIDRPPQLFTSCRAEVKPGGIHIKIPTAKLTSKPRMLVTRRFCCSPGRPFLI
jgi:hypothetical protein